MKHFELNIARVNCIRVRYFDLPDGKYALFIIARVMNRVCKNMYSLFNYKNFEDECHQQLDTNVN